jgi:predicted dehydrogenase
MSLRWGILSTAHITEKLLRSGTDATFAAVASRSPERARAFAEAHGIPRAHGSYEALLADPEIDAVYVPLPNALHVEWSIRALEAGKHVLCEKPMSRRPDEVERAFAAAERAGRVLAEAFMWRHHPQLARARELIASGAIGRLRVLRATFGFVAATLRFPDDVLATIDCGLDYVDRDELEAIGDRGSLFLDDPWHGREAVVEVRRADRSVERIETGPANSYALELADFAAAVAGERDPLLGRDDALGQARTIAALYRSADRKEPACP